MEREALTPLGAPPEGPARIALDPEGFVALRPDPASLARDAVVIGLVVLAVAGTLAGLVMLVTRGWSGFMCLLFVSPAILSSIGLPAMRRLILSARGARALRCTPSELVIERGGGVDRIPLAAVRKVRSAAMGEVIVDAGDGEQMIEIAGSEEQTRWLARAIRHAADRARRIPEPPAPPPALEALLERDRS